MIRFHRVHVEVTNICGLSCSFCPPKTHAPKTMSLAFFEKVLSELQGYTKELAFHVMGDPLTLSNLGDYLDLSYRYGFLAELTTSGYHLKKTPFKTLFHPAVRQLNISLNSFNKNKPNISFDEYMDGVFKVCAEKLAGYPKPFINLRLWNMDDLYSEAEFNAMLLSRLGEFFDVELDAGALLAQRPGLLRLGSKVILNFDSYFEWPSLSSQHDTQGSCYGLQSHIGILADGTVVPCCLDGEGVIALGNLHEASLPDILGSARSVSMREGFLQKKALEELCRRCSYKDRFRENTD